MNIKGSQGTVFDVHRRTEALLYSDPDTKAWLNNLPPRQRDGELRRFGKVCRDYKTTPKALKKLDAKQAFNFICQVRDDMAANGLSKNYISTVVFTLKGFFLFNDVEVTKRIRLELTPARFDKVPPSTEEVHELVRESDRRARVGISLIAFSGVRPEVLGNYQGTDGLKLRDIEGLSLKGGSTELAVVPAKVNVRAELSKNRRAYFSFLNAEGCTYLKAYLDWRLSKGLEELGPSSPVITSDQHQGRYGKHIKTKDVSALIRKPMRQLYGKKYRPYSLKHWFAHALVDAEADGLFPHEWKVFIIGHSGTVESKYTTEGLGTKDIEKMRLAYAKVSEVHLSTSPDKALMQRLEKERQSMDLERAAMQAELERLRAQVAKQHEALQEDVIQAVMARLAKDGLLDRTEASLKGRKS